MPGLRRGVSREIIEVPLRYRRIREPPGALDALVVPSGRADGPAAARGENQDWAACRVQAALEVQLPPGLPQRERSGRLEVVAAKSLYLQWRTKQAAHYHTIRRRRRLREIGIDLRRATRCPQRP